MNPSEPPSAFRLKFVPQALEEWNSLDGSVKETLRKLLKKRLQQPRLTRKPLTKRWAMAWPNHI